MRWVCLMVIGATCGNMGGRSTVLLLISFQSLALTIHSVSCLYKPFGNLLMHLINSQSLAYSLAVFVLSMCVLSIGVTLIMMVNKLFDSYIDILHRSLSHMLGFLLGAVQGYFVPVLIQSRLWVIFILILAVAFSLIQASTRLRFVGMGQQRNRYYAKRRQTDSKSEPGSGSESERPE